MPPLPGLYDVSLKGACNSRKSRSDRLANAIDPGSRRAGINRGRLGDPPHLGHRPNPSPSFRQSPNELHIGERHRVGSRQGLSGMKRGSAVEPVWMISIQLTPSSIRPSRDLQRPCALVRPGRTRPRQLELPPLQPSHRALAANPLAQLVAGPIDLAETIAFEELGSGDGTETGND